MVVRILCITDITMPGGVDTYIQQLIMTANLEDSKFEIFVLMNISNGADNLYRILQNNLNCKCIRKDIASSCSQEVIESNLQEVLQLVNPDVVHVICGWPRSALIIREYIANQKIPFFFTESLIDKRWKFDEKTNSRIVDLYEKAIKVFTVSSNNSEIIRNIYGWPADKIITVANGVDTNIIRKRCNAGKISKFVTVTRLEKQKGIDVLIQAIHRLPPQYRENLSFTIWGEGSERQKYERYIQKYGLTEYIFMPGWNNCVPNELCNYDCFILPSRFEGMPIALIEAMAAKLFCIGANVSGIPEVLQNGQYGLMFESECVDDLCSKICYCVEHSDFCNNIALKGYDYVTNNHNCYQNMKIIVDLWKRM